MARKKATTYNIPENFDMGGQTLKVDIVKTISVEGVTGLYKHYENKIQVQTHINDVPIDRSIVEQTFWHEYAHCLLDQCRQEGLSANEELVDLMGEFLYQSLGKKVKWR